MALGSTQPLTEMSTRNYFLGGKGGRRVGLKTFSSSCANCLEIWEPQTPGTHRACTGLYRDCFTFTVRRLFLKIWKSKVIDFFCKIYLDETLSSWYKFWRTNLTWRMTDNILCHEPLFFKALACRERRIVEVHTVRVTISYSYSVMADCTVCVSNPGEARFFAPVQIYPGAQPPSCKVGTGSLSQEQICRGVALTTHLHLVPKLKKE
jgi:hypothetical protein